MRTVKKKGTRTCLLFLVVVVVVVVVVVGHLHKELETKVG